MIPMRGARRDYQLAEEAREAEAEHQLANCGHIAIVSISPTETQCMDCLRIWPKEPGFVSDWPQYDRG